MSKMADDKMVQRAVALETQVIDNVELPSGGASKRLFAKIDEWKQVFQLKSNGMNFNAIARVMGINRKTASLHYQRYVELQSKVLVTRIETNQMSEITEYLERLEYQRQQVALELSTMDIISANSTTLRSEDYAAKLATRKILLEIEKQIADTKKGLGIWQDYEKHHFTGVKKSREKKIEVADNQEARQERILQLLNKGRKLLA